MSKIETPKPDDVLRRMLAMKPKPNEKPVSGEAGKKKPAEAGPSQQS